MAARGVRRRERNRDHRELTCCALSGLIFFRLVHLVLSGLLALLLFPRCLLKTLLLLDDSLAHNVCSLEIFACMKCNVPVHRVKNGQHDLLLLPLAHLGALCSCLFNQRLCQAARDLVHAVKRHWRDASLTPDGGINVLERDFDGLVFVDFWLCLILVPLIFNA